MKKAAKLLLALLALTGTASAAPQTKLTGWHQFQFGTIRDQLLKPGQPWFVMAYGLKLGVVLHSDAADKVNGVSLNYADFIKTPGGAQACEKHFQTLLAGLESEQGPYSPTDSDPKPQIRAVPGALSRYEYVPFKGAAPIAVQLLALRKFGDAKAYVRGALEAGPGLTFCSMTATFSAPDFGHSRAPSR